MPCEGEKMKTDDIILIVLLAAVVGVLLFAVFGSAIFPIKIGGNLGNAGSGSGTGYAGSTGIKQSASGFKTVSTGSTNQGEVEISLTPQGVDNGKLAVDIALNTHSVDTSKFDLKQITTLEYEGKSIKPSSAPSLSGHHFNGQLVFDVGKDIKSFTITLSGIPKVEKRVYTWP